VVVEGTPEKCFEAILGNLRERFSVVPGIIESRRPKDLRFPIEFEFPDVRPDSGRKWVLLIPANAPFAIPKLAIRCSDSNDQALSNPHVEDRDSGRLCLARDEDVKADPKDYSDTCIRLISRGLDYIAEDWAESGEDEFRREWLSYWLRESVPGLPSVHVNFRLEDIRRGLFAAITGAGWIVSSGENGITRVAGCLGLNPGKYKAIPVPVLALDRAPVPDEFPRTFTDLQQLFHMHGAGQSLKRCLRKVGERVLIWLIVCRDENGYSVAGGRLDLRQVQAYSGVGRARGFVRRQRQLSDGFRGMPPMSVLQTRLSTKTCGRCTVRRYDHAWIHGRQHDEDADMLRESKVVIFGAGSLGSGVAELLVKAGVGELQLVDPDSMEPENASRHALGCSAVGKIKAVCLAEILCRHDPSVVVEGHGQSGEDWLRNTGRMSLGRFNLIIDATGDWPFAAYLDSFLRGDGSPHPPVLWTWLEAHCAAGHAVLTSYLEGCVRCFLHGNGTARLSFLSEGGFSVDTPACGGAFQPYGAVDLASAQSLAADLALEALTDPDLEFEYRSWIGGSKKMVRIQGAEVSEVWKASCELPGEFPKVIRHSLAPCPACGRGES